jgi:hypothetical protein
LEIANYAISTFPQRRRFFPFFPTKRLALRALAPPQRKENPHQQPREESGIFRLIPHWNQTSISGSFQDWKMLP